MSFPGKKSIAVLYEDDFFIAFDKPAGLLVIPSDKEKKNTLSAIVNRSREEGAVKFYPCHRLDKETSGLILYAKGKKNQQVMMDIFKQRNIRKMYLALVHGAVPGRAGVIDHAIRAVDKKKYAGNKRPQKALTKYKVLSRNKDFSVLEVYPVTGRRNQIRIHFADIKHPLLGDRKYAFQRDYKLKFRRAALHARRLEWTHPVSKKNIKIESQIPKDMEVFLERYGH